jgi:hypothetical protein
MIEWLFHSWWMQVLLTVRLIGLSRLTHHHV